MALGEGFEPSSLSTLDVCLFAYRDMISNPAPYHAWIPQRRWMLGHPDFLLNIALGMGTSKALSKPPLLLGIVTIVNTPQNWMGLKMVQPIGPLMIEHRLIERMISVMEHKIGEMEKAGEADAEFIEVAVDFIRTYADRLHHGKEEKILFRDLEKKEMKPDDRRIMEELIQEHIKGRNLTGSLVAARERYVGGDEAALIAILDILKKLVTFYPKHIEKEDKVFFKPAMGYLSEDERDAMLEEEHEFDKQFTHVVYGDIVSRYETE